MRDLLAGNLTRHARRSGVALTLTLTLTFTSSPSALAGEPSPQEVQLARTLFEEGIKLEKKGDCAQALERYRRVATVKSSPSLKYHTGFCHEQLHEEVPALTYYQQAEAEATQRQNQEVLAAVKAPLARLTQRVPRLVPTVTEVSGLEVSIDGKPIPQGLWGMEIRVEVGRHTLEGKAVGYAPFSQTRDYAEGSRTELKIVMSPTQTAAPAVAPVPTPQASTAPTSAPPAPSAAPPPAPRAAAESAPATATAADAPTSSHGPSRAGAIVATAGAVLLVGGGVGSFVYAGSLADKAKTDCVALVSCDDKRGPVRTFDALALTGWIGGAGLGALAVVLWMSGGDKAAPVERHGTTLVPGPGSLTLRGTF